MEPLLGKGAEYAIDKTIAHLYAELKKADNYAQDDVARCKAYLEAAQMAIQGLENEYDEILNDAETCRLDQLDRVLALDKRILDYLQLDRFRDVLWRVHAGLRGCRTALQANIERQWWPGRGETRQAALADFVRTLETLEGYIADLQDQDLKYRQAFTGVGIKWLVGIREHLTSAAEFHSLSGGVDRDGLSYVRAGLVRHIGEARQDRSKDRLRDSTTRITDTIETLIRSFR